jgi:menaquinol-cytochrome c reductase cytochrome b/c subunit
MAAPPVERTRPAPPPERRARRERDEEVLVWPDLVFVEFIAAVLLTVTLTILSAAISGPLLDKANPDATPNPSKAPWYFLNLQELLLHMHPALAGVVVPTIFLILLAAVPYFDRSNEGQGVWFGTRDAVRISIFSMVFAWVITWALIFYDEGLHQVVGAKLGLFDQWPEQLKYFANVRAIQASIPWPEWTTDIPYLPFNLELRGQGFQTLDLPALIVEQVIPVIAMVGIPLLLLLIVRVWIGRLTKRDAMIVLFTGFITTFVVLTVVGTAFRGEGMALVWPWEVPTHPE